MSNTAETPTIIQPDISANRATNLRKRLFTWFAEQQLHCIVFIAYVTVTVTVSCFHEPWFDEAQAWLIARDCSWKELLTVRTHYEGHPPLWWMLLAIPAKLGMPYEIGLKSLNLMCAALMIWLLEFKTKLPELLKVILPFSYFLCYQYGVTSRPYALMIAAMLLIAINWNNRNTKPWPVILSMMLLCATSSYGLAIAGMLALNWTIQFLCGERSLIKNKQRFAGLVLLLVFAIILLLTVLPAPGTYHGDFDIHGTATSSPAWVSVFNTWLVMPSETLFTSTLSDGNMQFIALTPSELFMPCVMSCLMWCFLIQICLRRKTASLLLTTYLGISVAFTAHLSMHHAGIILGFFIAILAIDCDIEKINSNDWPQWIRNLNNRVMTLLGPKKTERYLRFFKILGLIFMLVSVYWTASASICDIRYDYSSSRAVASFIKTNHLEQYRWMAGWTRVSKNDTASNPEINKIIDKGGNCGGTDCIDYTSWYGSTLIDSAPYFDHTLLANAYKGRSYSSWEWCVDPYAGKKDIETWKSWGEPEFYDTLYQPFFFSDLGYDRNHYTKIKIAETKTPWKSTWSEGACEIYVRNDIYENVLHSPDPGIDWPDGATRR